MAGKPDPVFEAYARTAPLEDLRFTINRSVIPDVSKYDLPEQTLGIVGRMLVLERELVATLARTGSVKSFKAQVLSLTSTYRGSIPGFAGTTNAWYDENREYLRLSEKCRGPVPLARLQRRLSICQARAERKNSYRLTRRAVPLTVEEATAVIHAAAPSPMVDVNQAPKARVTRAARVAAVTLPTPELRIVCPACTSGRLNTNLTCTSCPASYTLLPRGFLDRDNMTPVVTRPLQVLAEAASASTPTMARSKARKPMTGGRAAVDWAAAGRKAAETRRRRLAEMQQAGAAA